MRKCPKSSNRKNLKPVVMMLLTVLAGGFALRVQSDTNGTRLELELGKSVGKPA